MSGQLILDNARVIDLAMQAAKQIVPGDDNPTGVATVYAIPRGGIPAAYAMRAYSNFHMVDDPVHADFIVDDIYESGATMERVIADAVARRLPAGRKFMGPRNEPPKPVILVDKRLPEFKGQWIVFPWEETAAKGVEDHFVRILQYVGEDPQRGGLIETPARAAKAWLEWCSGYGQDPAAILKCFEDGAEGYNEMVVVKDIPFYSKCEHHMADIFGTATIAYIPDGKVVGLSKLSRVLDAFARRLQVQERLTAQVADCLMEHLTPKGVGVVIRARHMCMESRGVRQQGHHTVTSALRGVIYDGAARQEFLSLVNG